MVVNGGDGAQVMKKFRSVVMVKIGADGGSRWRSIKVNGVTDDALHLYLFPHSLTHHAIAWFDHLPMNSITTFEQMAKMFLEKYFPPSMVTKLRNEITNFRQRPDESLFEAWERYKISIDRGTFMKRRPEECYDLIENMTAHHNDWDTSVQRSESSSSITSFCDSKIIALKVEINKNLMKVLQINHQVKAVTLSYETCGGYMLTMIVQPPLAKLRTYMLWEPIIKVMNTASSSGSRTLQSNTITNPKEDLKGITTRSGNAYKGPTIPTTFSPPKVVERETELTKDTVPPTNNESTKDVQPLVVQVETPIPNSEPITGRALIDVYEGELTLRIGNKAITFNLDQTSRYSADCDAMSVNRIDLIDVVCEEYSQEILGFSMSGNPTPFTKPIVSNSSHTLTPFAENPQDQEKTTFTCPYRTFTYCRMPFGLCNAPGMFQRCMMAIFHDMIEKMMEVFMDDFSVFGNSFRTCLSHLDKMLKRCEDTNLCLNWEKSHFIVKEGIVPSHKISKDGIEVDKANVDVITKLPHPTTIKGIRSFVSHAGSYR
nr:reverse transcriptase domain-containing protein [Tanacetum cinerariifolium]